MQSSPINILGVNFFNGNTDGVIEIINKGALLVVPAAPALSNIKNDISYYQALLTADVAIPDSGYMSLIWNLFHKRKINRMSGFEFLKAFLNDQEVRKKSKILLVNPNADEEQANVSYLHKIGFRIRKGYSYIAPRYVQPLVEDETLLRLIEAKRPTHVIINIGGGTQEKLGAYLKRKLSYMPGIICTGAAIAFLTGRQVKIPQWADKLYLGWFCRCAENPRLYVPRYFKAFKLAMFIFRYGKYQPVEVNVQPIQAENYVNA